MHPGPAKKIGQLFFWFDPLKQLLFFVGGLWLAGFPELWCYQITTRLAGFPELWCYIYRRL